ncbi:MAG: transcription-repair coupling factor [Phycisphaeraceae bacterium]|nr:transcription-repair coupling factor [Phycisphaeraceae bacterium]
MRSCSQCISPDRLDDLARTIERGQRLPPGELLDWLDRAGYKRVEAVDEPGDFAVRGGIVDVFSPGSDGPVRLDFFGDDVETIREIDIATMGSDRALDRCELIAAADRAARVVGGVSFLDVLPSGLVAVLDEPMEIVEQGRGYFERVLDGHGIFGPPAVLAAIQQRAHAVVEIGRFVAGAAERVDLPLRGLRDLPRDVGEAIGELRSGDGATRLVFTCQGAAERARLTELIAEHAPGSAGPEIVDAYVHRGFELDTTGGALRVAPYHELLHRFEPRRRTARLGHAKSTDVFLGFDIGDYVVHADHGIARFVGLEMIRPRPLPGRPHSKHAEPEEYLTLEFDGGSRLHVPATRIDLVQRYIGGFKGKPPLSTLGGARWKNQKARVAESVRDLAAELLRVRAARESMPGVSYPEDSALMREFEDDFPYEETEDQLAALAEIKRDMSAPRPMDRLICGDVGFGKTELAIRAAFKAVEAGRQVAVLVPTTLLAVQHERSFGERFAGYPVRVESLTRFKTDAQARAVLSDLGAGRVDVLIGTHRLLSGDVAFKNLGLVVVDEEQRFGVEHKESLLRLRMTVDVLTLSATPIPRTLHMAMLGLRDISSLTTAPSDRRSVVTEVLPHNDRRIARAIARELARDGQVFYVHNRVRSIRRVADEVRRLAPEARIVVGHGQMPAHELEDVMLAFLRREADVLVATTIIESGIDIPSANTMFITDADRFGLADLHQLRGRVGRSKHRAYCYLLLPDDRTLSEVAKRRLQAIEQFSMLGAGFRIAMRDLEIRGAGNLLGAEQSGHIAAVGYDMYCRLLDGAVTDLRNERPPPAQSATSVEVAVSGTIPRAYIPSDRRRLEAYRRIATADSFESVSTVERDLGAAYGSPPAGVVTMLALAEVRIGLASAGVRSLVLRDQDLVFRARRPEDVRRTLEGASGTVRVLAPEKNDDTHEVFWRPPASYLEPATLLRVLRARFGGERPTGQASERETNRKPSRKNAQRVER